MFGLVILGTLHTAERCTTLWALVSVDKVGRSNTVIITLTYPLK